MSLATLWAYAPPDKLSMKRLRRERGWWLWLVPRPFTLVSTAIYLILLFGVLSGDCDSCIGRPWETPLLVGTYLALLALDRLDYWFFGETPPSRAALLLIVFRILLIEAIALIAGLWFAMWLYALLPYIAALYFGAKGGYFLGAFVWVAVVGRMAWDRLTQVLEKLHTYLHYDWTDFWGQFISGVVSYSILLIFVVMAAKIVLEERASRAEAERLLSKLGNSHRQLEAYSEQALSATQERNRLARDIHDSLGHYLTVISVQLDKALTFRALDPQAADQAVGDAKHLASEALQDVRRSVGALRGTGEVSSLPTAPEGADDFRARTPANGYPGPHTAARGWRFWLAPRSFDLVSASLYLGILIMDFGWPDASDPIWLWKSVSFAGALLALIVVDRLDYRFFGEAPPARTAAFLFALRLMLIGVVGISAGLWYILWLVPLIPYIGFLYYGNRGGYRVGVIVWVALSVAAIGLVLNDESSPGQFNVGSYVTGLFFISTLMLVVIVTSRTILKERASRARAEELLAELESSHRQLKVYSDQSLSVMLERNRLARDIHDGLGHYLTVINVQLEKALAFRALDPQAADQALHDAKRLTAEALQEVRRTMGELRSSRKAFFLPTALAELVKNVGDGNVKVGLRLEGKEAGFSEHSLMALYRAAQEGLTNIQKHARASEVVVELRFTDHEAMLDLSDNGRGFEPVLLQDLRPDRDKCYGLQGVRERLELVGGTMDVESRPGEGTCLHISVPRDPRALSGMALSPAQGVV